MHNIGLITYRIYCIQFSNLDEILSNFCELKYYETIFWHCNLFCNRYGLLPLHFFKNEIGMAR